jgi:hypothetical protein
MKEYVDSPVGLAGYFLDHDARSYELISRGFAGESAGLTRDDILDNITLTWLTNTALSGARLYWGKLGSGRAHSGTDGQGVCPFWARRVQRLCQQSCYQCSRPISQEVSPRQRLAAIP